MIVTLIVIALGVSLTRFIPFYVLKDKTPPQSMQVLLDSDHGTPCGLCLQRFKHVKLTRKCSGKWRLRCVISLEKKYRTFHLMFNTIIYGHHSKLLKEVKTYEK